MTRAPLVPCLIAVLAAGCATRGAARQIAGDLKTARTDLGILRETQTLLTREMATMAADAKAAAATTEELQKAVSAATADVGRLAARLDATEEAIKQVREVVEARAAPVAPPPPAEHRREIHAGSVENAYTAGLVSFRAREYGQAVLDFLDVVAKHPTHVLAPSAQYWIGEAYYRQHDYRQALVEFQKVVDWGSANPKLADALVKAGLCYNNLREKSRAQEAWQRVLREFPGEPAAAQARTLLSSLRSPTRR
jgi:tol-pal system protein YbgF